MKKLLFQLLPLAIIVLYGCQGEVLPTPTSLTPVTSTTNGFTYGTNISPSSIVVPTGSTTTSTNTNSGNSNGNSTTSNSPLSVTINGASDNGSFSVDTSSSILALSLTVYYYSVASSTFTLSIPKSAKVGNYVTDNSNYSVYYSTLSDSYRSNISSSSQGTITVVITSVNGKTIKGTFSGSVSDGGTTASVLPITNGSFSVTY
jgi:hypothetical protein